jgi:hypothetical protein
LLDELKALQDELRKLRRDLRTETTARVSRRSERAIAERLGQRWFSEFAAQLVQQVPPEVVDRYSAGFKRLLELSGGQSQRAAYLRVIDGLVKSFQRDLILPSQTLPSIPQTSASLLRKILSDLPDPGEDSYLREAIACAESGYFRAAVVMGWCAAIDRIHRVVESEGFPRFNIASARMASETMGRFKRFNSPQNVASVSDLRAVFDTQILWILEGMGMLDLNQHTRLRSCFELRTQCSHPGDAPTTEFNLMSFFSDLNEIVFRNEQFALPTSP